MNFTTDKDLRKAVPKVVPKAKKNSALTKSSVLNSKPPTSIPSVDEIGKIASKSSFIYLFIYLYSYQVVKFWNTGGDIVALARHERVLRESNRALVQSTLLIQRWWRGRSVAVKTIHQIQTSLDSKLLDISKLLSVIPSFAAPAEVSFLLLRHVLLNTKRSIQLHIHGHFIYVTKYCRFLLLPSLAQLDQPSKNIMVVASSDPNKLSLLVDFFLCCLNSLNSSTSKQLPSDDRTLIARSIFELLGGGAPFKMKFSKDISTAYDSFRATLRGTISYTFYRSSLRKSIEYLKSRDLLSAISEVLLKCTTTSLSESGYNTQKRCEPATTVTTGQYQNAFGAVNEPDFLVAAYIMFMRRESDFSRTVELLSIPMITLMLSPSFVENFLFHTALSTSSNRICLLLLLDSVFDYEMFRARYNISANTCHPHIPNAFWILGNILSFSQYCLSSAPSTHLTDGDLKLYLDTCTIWLMENPMNDILLGRKGITWARSGSSMTAVAIPDGLENQVLSLLNGDVIRYLSNRYLSTVWFSSEGWDSVASSKDMEEIQSALSSNSYVMTKSALKHVEQENTWFTSKWARKLTSSFVETINAPFSTAFQATKSASGSLGMKSSEGANLTMVGSLCRLWAILLTQASMATNDSLPRKALMTLAFSGGTIERLWAAFLLSCGLDSDGFARNHSIDRFVLVSSDKRHAAVDSVTDCFAILICFVALFRAHLLALNDSELYDKGVSCAFMHLLISGTFLS